MELQVDGVLERNSCLVAPMLMCGVHIILGMDIVKRLGEVCIRKDGGVSWGQKRCALGVTSASGERPKMRIQENDFTAEFDGRQ